MIYDYTCPFCNKFARTNDQFVETRGYIEMNGGKTIKRQYFHRECFYKNTIGAVKEKESHADNTREDKTKT